MKRTENGDKSFCSKTFEMKGFFVIRSRNDGNKRKNSTPIMSRGKKSGIAPRELFPVLRYPRGAINKPFRRLKDVKGDRIRSQKKSDKKFA